MASPPSSIVSRRVGILVLDNDARSSGALHQILDSEGCRVRVATDIALLVAELKTGEWSLVIANAPMIGVDTPLAYTLRELGRRGDSRRTRCPAPKPPPRSTLL